MNSVVSCKNGKIYLEEVRDLNIFEDVVRGFEEQCTLLDVINKAHTIPEESKLAQEIIESDETSHLELHAITKEMDFDGGL